MRSLLAHRLPGTAAAAAKAEWTDIVEGEHPLWAGLSEPYKHTIRAFLVYFNTQIQRQATERFNFKNGSVGEPLRSSLTCCPSEQACGFRAAKLASAGNFFFAGARLFFRSLEAAIFLFSRVARIPEGSLVLPVIRTEGKITLGAELLDGDIIRGQNEISHPLAPKGETGHSDEEAEWGDHCLPFPRGVSGIWKGRLTQVWPLRRAAEPVFGPSQSGQGRHRSAAPRPHQAGAVLGNQGRGRDRGAAASEPARADRAQQRRRDCVRDRVLVHLHLPLAHPRGACLSREGCAAQPSSSRCDATVQTSRNAAQGVGEMIARRDVPKVLLLNGSHDRETSAALDHGGLMAASDVVKAICSALNREYGRPEARLEYPTSAYVTAVLAPKGGSIVVDKESLVNLGVRCAQSIPVIVLCF